MSQKSSIRYSICKIFVVYYTFNHDFCRMCKRKLQKRKGTRLKRIQIFTGHYGSGKTEIALNFAMQQSKQGSKVVLVDMDIVNPYFRSKDAFPALQAQGIEVIAPEYANTNVDLPSLPAEIASVFDQEDRLVVLDVGGDDEGAIALGRYSAAIVNAGYDMYFVVNPLRPMTDTVEKAAELAAEIEAKSRLTLTHLINNTNLQQETTAQMIKEQAPFFARLSDKLTLDVAFLSATPEVLAQMDSKDKTFSLDTIYLKLPF